MPAEPSKPSFSPRRKWGIGFQVFLIVFVVFSVVVMVNYLSRDYFHRFNWSSENKIELSPQTISFLRSLTNHVKVTVYYNRDEPFFSTITSLLNEYRYVNRRISIETVDYLRDAGAAQRVKSEYKLIFPTATNLVIFDCEGKVYAVEGSGLVKYTLEQMPYEQERTFLRKPVAFEGEKSFTTALLALSNPDRPKAFFLEGHGEHSIMSSDTNYGYSTFRGIIEQNWVLPQQLHSLLGSNSIPADCNLLVIAGPTTALQEGEVEKIDRWLSQGGHHLLALFNYSAIGRDTDLSKILAKWGVEVGASLIKDPDNSMNPEKAFDIRIGDFSRHPLVSPLAARAWKLHLIAPRSVGKAKSRADGAEAARVEEIAFSATSAYADGDPAHKKVFPLITVVEKGDQKGVISASTRMLIAGDSIFLGNQMIESAANRDFAGYVVNWLLDRSQMLQGLGPRPILQYRSTMTRLQLVRAEWILLAGMPGCALFLGSLVWWRRRK